MNEPFKGLFTQGMVCHETYKDQNNNWLHPDEVATDDGKIITNNLNEKVIVGPMNQCLNQRKYNRTSKNDRKYGADAVRLFILSDSPPEKDVKWSGRYDCILQVYSKTLSSIIK